MNKDDQILRAYATITSIRANVPERPQIEERWVKEFNAAIEKLEKSLDIDLQEFKVPQDAIKRFVASCNSQTNDVTYLEGLWCERAILMQSSTQCSCASRAYKTGTTIRSVFNHSNSAAGRNEAHSSRKSCSLRLLRDSTTNRLNNAGLGLPMAAHPTGADQATPLLVPLSSFCVFSPGHNIHGELTVSLPLAYPANDRLTA